MPIPSPNLDDRRFEDLLTEAKRRAAELCPQWKGLDVHDPGVVLLEAFAHLTELMLYRLNRVPQEKVYVALLNLMGVTPHPPVAATVDLVFSLAQPAVKPLEIPLGAQVTSARVAGGSAPPVFATMKAVTIPAGGRNVTVTACHAELIEGELAGAGTGRPGLVVHSARKPLIAPTGDELDLAVRVEVGPNETVTRGRDVRWAAGPSDREGFDPRPKTYRSWRAVDHFIDVDDDPYAYVVDRFTGTIRFAPEFRRETSDAPASPGAGAPSLTPASVQLAAIPVTGREIRLWYRIGGGSAGNVGAGELTVLKKPIPGLTVTNPQAATGGRDAETFENTMLRGPQEIHSIRRAVTARDFELLAIRLNPGSVTRAKAVTLAEVWKHARAGTVELLLVPYIPADAIPEQRVTAQLLRARETSAAVKRVVDGLEPRKPIGAECSVRWVSYKGVSAKARVIVQRGDDRKAIADRIAARLYSRINPLPVKSEPGWTFGEALRESHVFDIALEEPGVKYVEQVAFAVDEVPDGQITALTPDASQPRTWYAGMGHKVFRSMNDGAGWELITRLTDANQKPVDSVHLIESHPEQPGLVAVCAKASTTGGGKPGYSLHFSRDCGETWPAELRWNTDVPVEDMAWRMRDGQPELLLATSGGLRPIVPGSAPDQVIAVEGLSGIVAVVVARDLRGRLNVAVTVLGKGVYLSREGGNAGTFRSIGPNDEAQADVHGLFVNPNGTLWAAVTSVGDAPGKGAFSWDLTSLDDPKGGWVRYSGGWEDRGGIGSCRSLAFDGNKVYAATWSGGVPRLDLGEQQPRWKAAAFKCGLPTKEGGGFKVVPLVAVSSAAHANHGTPRLVLAAGDEGIFRSDDGGETFELCSSRDLKTVTLPDNWLFCSSEHVVDAVSEDEAGKN
jgi:hypothetical protein